MTRHAKSHDRARQPMAWMRVARDILSFAVKHGANRQALRTLLPVSDEQLANLDGRIPLEAVYQLLERAAAVIDPERFGLRYGSAFQIEVFDALGFLMMTSPTLGAAFKRGMAYQRMWTEGERYELIEQDDAVRVRYHPFGPERDAHRLSAEMAFIDLGLNAGQLCHQPLPLKRVRFRHQGPLAADAYGEVFRCPVELGAPVNEIILGAEAMAWPLLDANAAMCAFFERHARERLEQLPNHDSTAGRVRALIGERLPEQVPSLQTVAQTLKMSARTLQRRLHDEGHSLNDLIDDVRRERAALFLDQPIAIAEVSYLLGYSEPSAFHRAFKRWTGTTPDAFRAAR